MWKQRPTRWFCQFLTFSHMISVSFQPNWLYLGLKTHLAWKKTEFMWENVKNLQNHLVGRCFHIETKPCETFHCEMYKRAIQKVHKTRPPNWKINTSTVVYGFSIHREFVESNRGVFSWRELHHFFYDTQYFIIFIAESCGLHHIGQKWRFASEKHESACINKREDAFNITSWSICSFVWESSAYQAVCVKA